LLLGKKAHRMDQDTNRKTWERKMDRRNSSRVRITVQGKLFIVSEQHEIDCIVLDLSSGGAGVQCSPIPPRKSNVILYVDGFGRFEGVTTQPTRDGTGIHFECTQRKRERIDEQLKLYVSEGLKAVTHLRQSARMEPVDIPNFITSDGEIVGCEVLDISLTGTSLKTTERPPIDDVITFGRMEAQVVRHHDRGIGVRFIGELPPPV
jgi:hypothetical protein